MNKQQAVVASAGLQRACASAYTPEFPNYLRPTHKDYYSASDLRRRSSRRKRINLQMTLFLVSQFTNHSKPPSIGWKILTVKHKASRTRLEYPKLLAQQSRCKFKLRRYSSYLEIYPSAAAQSSPRYTTIYGREGMMLVMPVLLKIYTRGVMEGIQVPPAFLIIAPTSWPPKKVQLLLEN